VTGRKALMGRFKSWLDAGLAFFYPDVCQLCRSEFATASEGYVGSRCWQSVRFIRRPYCERCGLPYEGEITTEFECANCREMELHFQSARAAVAAGELVLEVIHRYKYQRALWFEPFLADLLVRAARPVLAGGNWELIVPVPLHPLKQRQREFNQAERLARRLSSAVNVPLNAGLIERVEPTRTQTLLNRQQRSANVRHAFAPRRHRRLNGERVVVVDDVLTTGATTSACARVLQEIGAGDVAVWTVARGL
jgi:competence protein ComFC